MKTIKSKRIFFAVGVLVIVLVIIGLFIRDKIMTDNFFNKKRDIRTGMKVSDLMKLVGRPTFELLVDSTSINVAGFPKDLVNEKIKYYIFTYTMPSIKNWISKFNNLDFSYDVYVDEKKEKVIYF
jgi:hypothetical protein